MPIQGNIPRCQYIKVDGRRCGSPSLKTKRWCYFHYEVNRPTYNLDIPPLEDGDAVQLALTDLARAVADSRVDLKQAALLAYILQTASANLKSVHLGCHTADMVRDLPDLDPFARGPAPQPGERNRDPERVAPSAPSSVSSVSSVVKGSEGIPPRLRASAVRRGPSATGAGPSAGSPVRAASAGARTFR